MIRRVHHIDYVVRDLDQAIAAYQKLFSVQLVDRREFPARAVELAWFELESVKIILVSPTRLDSPVQKFLDENGEGFFHIAYEVDDLQSFMDHLAEHDMKPWVGSRRRGVEGWSLIDIDPEETFGVHTQLVEVD